MITEEQITQAYASLALAASDLYKANENLADTKSRLDRAVATGLLAGTITGKNAMERDASARTELAELYSALDDRGKLHDLSKLQYDLAQLEVDKVRLLMRLYELPKELGDEDQTKG